MPVNRNEYPELFDEQDEYEATVTFHSGTYFDEIYHARTAYEMIHGCIIMKIPIRLLANTS